MAGLNTAPDTGPLNTRSSLDVAKLHGQMIGHSSLEDSSIELATRISRQKKPSKTHQQVTLHLQPLPILPTTLDLFDTALSISLKPVVNDCFTAKLRPTESVRNFFMVIDIDIVGVRTAAMHRMRHVALILRMAIIVRILGVVRRGYDEDFGLGF